MKQMRAAGAIAASRERSTMPESALAWVQYGYFAGGALGGWVLLVLCIIEKVREWKFRRKPF